MSKYIRTKNGILEVVNSFVDYKNKKIYETPMGNLIDEGDVLVERDKIEELFDEIVMGHYFKETNLTDGKVLKETKELFVKSVMLRKEDKDYDENEFNIYGSIWITLPNQAPRLEPISKLDAKKGWILL